MIIRLSELRQRGSRPGGGPSTGVGLRCQQAEADEALVGEMEARGGGRQGERRQRLGGPGAWSRSLSPASLRLPLLFSDPNSGTNGLAGVE